MKIKRSMAALFLFILCFFSYASLAFGITEAPDTLEATEKMGFDPLAYVTLLLVGITAASVAVSCVFASKYKEQREHSCQNLNCINNPLAQESNEDFFDYSQIETPEELIQSSVIHSQPVQQDVAVAAPEKKKHVARHKKEVTIDPNATAPIPRIKLVPEMKHSRRRKNTTQPVQLDERPVLPTIKSGARMPRELECLVRKIS